MKFRSNNCLDVVLPDLKKAEAFYSTVLGFRLISRSATQLEFDTGRFFLRIEEGTPTERPIPALTVIDAKAARSLLSENGCAIVPGREPAFRFTDPFGIVFNVVED